MLTPPRKEKEPVITYKVITDVTEEVVTLQQAKDFLQVDFDDFDWLIELLITSSREEAEKFTGLSIGVREIELEGDYKNPIAYMPYEPITEDDGNGKQTVGYDSTTCPGAIKLAILRMVHTHFEYRNDIEKSSVTMLDINAEKILKPFRRRVGL